MNERLAQFAATLGEMLKKLEWKLVTAESCTGGGLAYYVTHVPGSSAWFERGFVTYSNLAKEECLNIDSHLLTTFGAVSAETARAMAEGALQNSQAQVSISITGIAGPDGGSIEKPVGTVWIALASINKTTHAITKIFSGERAQIREQTIEWAFTELMGFISNS